MKKFLPFSLVILALALFSGCATNEARYIDPKGTETIVSLNKINIQDWNQAADELVADMLTSGVLDRAPELPALMAVSRITNKTTSQADTNSLTKKVRVALNQSGKVVTTTTMGYGGNVEDPMAQELAQMQTFMSGEKQQTRLPYYTLSGLLLEDRAKSGNTNQVTYTFQMSLTTTSDGIAVWESEKQITKIGKKSTVGW
jgi:uncharacterized protein (TIGR02722 family)